MNEKRQDNVEHVREGYQPSKKDDSTVKKGYQPKKEPSNVLNNPPKKR